MAGLGNYTFLTSDMAMARPNVYAGLKRRVFAGISNVHQNHPHGCFVEQLIIDEPDGIMEFLGSLMTCAPCGKTHVNASTRLSGSSWVAFKPKRRPYPMTGFPLSGVELSGKVDCFATSPRSRRYASAAIQAVTTFWNGASFMYRTKISSF